MKKKSIFSLSLLLVTLSIAFSSCYMGFYQPYPRYGYSGGPVRVVGPRYHYGGGVYYGGHGRYGGYRGGGYRGGRR